MFTTKTVVGTILLFTARNITYLSLFVRFHTQLIHLRTTMCTMFRQQVQYKNSKTGTYLIRESEAAQADSLYHISGTQYTWSCVRYIFHIYTLWQIKKWGLWQTALPISPLYPHRNEFNQMEMYMYANIGTVWKNYFPRSIFSVLYFDTLYNRSCVLMMTGQLVGPQKGHIASLWRYGGRQPPSSECHPSSSGLSDQHMRSHQAHRIWLWHWSCKRLSQESMGPHNTL